MLLAVFTGEAEICSDQKSVKCQNSS